MATMQWHAGIAGHPLHSTSNLTNAAT